MKYPWHERLDALTRPPLPNVSLWRLNQFVSCAAWVLEEFVLELESEGWQPAHMFRPPESAAKRGGLCWQWVPHRTQVSRIDGHHIITRGAGLYFVYYRAKDGRAPLLTGVNRRKVLEKYDYPVGGGRSIDRLAQDGAT